MLITHDGAHPARFTAVTTLRPRSKMEPMRGLGRWVVLLAFGGLLAVCGHNTGSLMATLTYSGGRSPGPGTVKVMSGGEVVASQRLFSSQTFRFDLSPGSYQVGSTGGCSTATVTVEADRTATVDIYCRFH